MNRAWMKSVGVVASWPEHVLKESIDYCRLSSDWTILVDCLSLFVVRHRITDDLWVAWKEV